MRNMSAVALAIILCASCFLLAQTPAAPAESKSPMTEISADVGPCSVEFHVTDLAGKPLYNAKIKTTVRYGFMSKRKVDLEAGTNADGRARFINLPAEPKKPIQFQVSYQDQTASYSIDPGTDCHAQRDVPLKTGTGETKK